MEHWLIQYSKMINPALLNGITIAEIPREAALLIADIVHSPHGFVLACCMTRQITFEQAWRIPYIVQQNLAPNFTIDELATIPLPKYKSLFNSNSLHRFNDKMATIFFDAVHRIKTHYNGDACKIWDGMPNSAEVVARFLEFNGVGIKIATMATNILYREFQIPFSDLSSIDVSPDVHIQRVFLRAGIVNTKNLSRELIIYRARALNPSYPGIVDAACWRLGRNFCFPTSPDCEHCPVKKECPKIL